MNKVNAGASAESFDSFKPKELPENVFSSDASRLYALSFDGGGVNMWLKTRLKFLMK